LDLIRITEGVEVKLHAFQPYALDGKNKTPIIKTMKTNTPPVLCPDGFETPTYFRSAGTYLPDPTHVEPIY
jgi:hypothetical protein